MKLQQKKGVSVMVSYVLLIVIIISLAALVYAYLKLYLPAKIPECPQDVSVSIDRANCVINAQKKELTIILRNSGLFNVHAIFVRMVPAGRKIGFQINANQEAFPSPITPSNTQHQLTYDLSSYSVSSGNSYTIEIQPAIIEKGKIVVCSDIATQSVSC